MTPEKLRERIKNEEPKSYQAGELAYFMTWVESPGRGYNFEIALKLPNDELMKYWLDFCLSGKERKGT